MNSLAWFKVFQTAKGTGLDILMGWMWTAVLLLDLDASNHLTGHEHRDREPSWYK